MLRNTSPQPGCKAALAGSELLIHGVCGQKGTEEPRGALQILLPPSVSDLPHGAGGGPGGVSVFQEHLVQGGARPLEGGCQWPHRGVRGALKAQAGPSFTPGVRDDFLQRGEAQARLRTNEEKAGKEAEQAKGPPQTRSRLPTCQGGAEKGAGCAPGPKEDLQDQPGVGGPGVGGGHTEEAQLVHRERGMQALGAGGPHTGMWMDPPQGKGAAWRVGGWPGGHSIQLRALRGGGPG